MQRDVVLGQVIGMLLSSRILSVLRNRSSRIPIPGTRWSDGPRARAAPHAQGAVSGPGSGPGSVEIDANCDDKGERRGHAAQFAFGAVAERRLRAAGTLHQRAASRVGMHF